MTLAAKKSEIPYHTGSGNNIPAKGKKRPTQGEQVRASCTSDWRDMLLDHGQ